MIPEHEQKQLIKEEEKRKRLELREAKVNLWKKWRKETTEKKIETEDSNKINQKKWLGKLEETLERLKREVEDRKRAQELYSERRNKLLAEQKLKQEELLRKEQERIVRKQNKKMLEERWAMARWIVGYIDENSDRWKKEQKDRQMNMQQTAEEWKRMERFEKIRVIKERKDENRVVKVSIRPAKLQRKFRAEHQHSQGTQSDQADQNDQAEQTAEKTAAKGDDPGDKGTGIHERAEPQLVPLQPLTGQGDDQADQTTSPPVNPLQSL